MGAGLMDWAQEGVGVRSSDMRCILFPLPFPLTWVHADLCLSYGLCESEYVSLPCGDLQPAKFIRRMQRSLCQYHCTTAWGFSLDWAAWELPREQVKGFYQRTAHYCSIYFLLLGGSVPLELVVAGAKISFVSPSCKELKNHIWDCSCHLTSSHRLSLNH